MPRDLTDLMERATSSAPPEPYAAADITSLAARRHRRRTTGIAAGLAATVLVAGAAGYGVTRGLDSAPEPAAPYRYDQHVDVSDAVPASTLPGYRLEPWTIPSVEGDLGRSGPWPTYRDVDARGRILVEDYPHGAAQPPRVRLDGAQGRPGRLLPQPPASGHRGAHSEWTPSFVGDGRLVWLSKPPTAPGFHITDDEGGHDVFVRSSFTVNHGQEHFGGGPTDGSPLWGDRYWFKVYDHNLPGLRGIAFDLYSATFSGRLTLIAKNVADAAAGGGRVAWVTTSGSIMTESATGGSRKRVDVTLDPGCRLPIQEMQSLSRMFTVADSAIALTEACGTQSSPSYALVAFDLSGRRLVDISGTLPFALSFAGDTLLFVSGTGEIQVMRYDLVTGGLTRLGAPGSRRGLADPRGSGDYVLWYDEDGGHVARIPQ